MIHEHNNTWNMTLKSNAVWFRRITPPRDDVVDLLNALLHDPKTQQEFTAWVPEATLKNFIRYKKKVKKERVVTPETLQRMEYNEPYF